MNCIISAYELNPRHKCGGGGAFFFQRGRKRGGQIEDEKKAREAEMDRGTKESAKDEADRTEGSAGVRREKRASAVCNETRVMENRSAARSGGGGGVGCCPVQAQWSGVFNLT